MTPIDFLRTVWPDDGFYCIAIKMPHGGWWHTVYPTITEAAEFVDRHRDRDVYFCVHSLAEERVWNPTKIDPKTGEKGAWSVRTQANMREARAFFFDLDVGQGNGKYPTVGEAVDDLWRFCNEALLPTPMIVKSGGGVHVYWLLEDAIQTHQWKVYAARLRALAEAHDLIVDPARTTDVASILRVAGTFNHKTGTPRPVEVKLAGAVTPTEEFIAMLTSACREAGVKAEDARPPARTTLPLPAHLQGVKGNIDEKSTKEFRPPPSPPALFKCPQADHALSTEGEVGYGEWRCWLSIFNCVEDGAQLCYEWSAGASNFDEAYFEVTMSNLSGPYSCAKVAEICGSERCQGCSFNGRGRTPVDFARSHDEADAPVIEVVVGDETVQVEIPDPPYPYSRMKGGGITKRATKEGEEDETIYDLDLFPIAFIVNGEKEERQSRWRLINKDGSIDEFTVGVTILYDKSKFISELPNKGVIMDFSKIQKVQAYMVAYIKQLQREAEAEAQHNHLGWKPDKSQFILPDRIFCDDGSVKPVHLSLNVTRACSFVGRAGTLEKQVELLSFYNHKDYLPNQFMILASLAAPILHMTGHHGAIVNASGDAGCSKSTSLYTGASFWGHPDRYPINGTNSGATVTARNNYMDTLANLPVCVDEITHIPLNEAKDMAMNVSQANGRVRSQRDGVQRAQMDNSRSTIMMTTANSSLHALLSSDNVAGTAGSMRVIEVAFKRTHIHTKHQADLYINQLLKNYGHIGPAFIQYVVKHQAEVEQRMLDTMAHLDSLCNIAPSERFWSATCAAILVACEIANKLGLLMFNVILLKNWIINVQLPYMRGVVVTQYATPLGILTEFLEQINNQILVTSPSKNDSDLGDNVIRDVNGPLSARYDIKQRIMWVMKKPFRDYCLKIGANHLTVLNALSERINGEAIIPSLDVRKVLGGRTRHAKALTPCFTINMDHPEISGMFAKPVTAPAPETNVLERPSEQTKGGKVKLPPINPFR